MVKAWYMDHSNEDKQLEHHRNPPEYIDIDELYKLTGVEYFKINVNENEEDAFLSDIKQKRGYTYQDQITCSKECLQNYEEKLKSFYTEHLHEDEESRLVMDGSGYFDVRDGKDQWIRIAVEKGDLIVIPSGIYHRFTLDSKNFIIARRFFIGEPVWTPFNRPADEKSCRQAYVKQLHEGFTKSSIQ